MSVLALLYKIHYVSSVKAWLLFIIKRVLAALRALLAPIIFRLQHDHRRFAVPLLIPIIIRNYYTSGIRYPSLPPPRHLQLRSSAAHSNKKILLHVRVAGKYSLLDLKLYTIVILIHCTVLGGKITIGEKIREPIKLFRKEWLPDYQTESSR